MTVRISTGPEDRHFADFSNQSINRAASLYPEMSQRAALARLIAGDDWPGDDGGVPAPEEGDE